MAKNIGNKVVKGGPKVPTKGPDQAKTSYNIVCYNCGKKGHYKSECPQDEKSYDPPVKGGRGGKKEALVKESEELMRQQHLGESDAIVDKAVEATDIEKEQHTKIDAMPHLEEEITKISNSALVLTECVLYADEGWNEQITASDMQFKYLNGAFCSRAMLHFYVSGYSEKTLQSANSKINLWFTTSGIQMSIPAVDEAVAAIWSIYKSRRVAGTWFEMVKLQLYDWWLSVTKSSLTWKLVAGLLVTAVVGVTVLLATQPLAWVVVGLGAMFGGLWGLGKWMNKQELLKFVKIAPLVDFCTGTTIHNLPEYDPRATLQPAEITKCVPVEFQVGFTISPGSIWIPRLCGHNELNALTTRQLLTPIGTTETRKETWAAGLAALLRDLPPVEEVSNLTPAEKLEKFLERYPETRRDVLRATYILIDGTYYIRESKSKCFVKREWLTGKLIPVRNPRLISGKTDEYLIESGPEYYFWQKAMIAEYWSSHVKAVGGKYIYTGGMTGDQIGDIFTHFIQMGYEVIEGDYSRYDGHNEEEALEAEMGYYNGVLPPVVVERLRAQLATVGKTASGHKFSCAGKVASGVINTSFGNTIRGFMIVAAYTEKYGLKDFAVMQLGDDNAIFVKDLEAFNLPRFVEFATTMGHKLEAVHRPDPDYAEYCSQRFWDVGGRYVLGPKPGRVLSKTFVSSNVQFTAADMPEYCMGIAMGFKEYTWIPILGGICRNLIKMRGNMDPSKVNKKVARALKKHQEHKITLKSAIEVDYDCVLAQFQKVYGFDAKALDRELETCSIQFGHEIRHSLLTRVAEVDGACSPQTTYLQYVNELSS